MRHGIRKYLIILLTVMVSGPVFGQYYGNYGGLTVRTNGYGLKYSHVTSKPESDLRRILNADFLIHKHPKEHRIYNPEIQNSGTYVYGKLNRVGILRLSTGISKPLVPRNEWSSIGMSYNLSAGPQLVGLKPVYLNIYHPGQNTNPGIITPEKYDPDVHTSQSNIVGYADSRYGWDELQLSYGLQTTGSLQMSWGNSGSGVKILQIGIGVDYYPSGLVVMANTQNPKLYGTLFASILWGVDGNR